jgi:hypothetical protein
MHMFKGGLTPWKYNAAWRQQALEERLAEEAARRKKREENGGGDIVARLVMILAGATIVWSLFGNPPPQ